MIYRIRRVDPYWLKHPAVRAAAVAAAAGALAAARAGSGAGIVVCALACAAAVLLATKPALSGTFATFGFAGGIVTFAFGSSGGLSPQLRVLATLGFSALYMVMMDGVVLAFSSVYNAFTTRLGLSGLSLAFED